jgi:hypothetical protein
VTGVLDPLAARYGGARVVIPAEPDGPVRAMPLVLRLEKPPPARTPVLEAAAAAALAVCLDPRAGPDGEWHDAVSAWVAGRIRKIARRARGAHWEAVQGLPGVTWTVGDAQVRALVPGPVDDVPRAVSRLQIGGTDLGPDEPGPPPARGPVIWVNAALEMTVGKAAAQVGHVDAVRRGAGSRRCPGVRRARGRGRAVGAAVRRGGCGVRARRRVHRGRPGHGHLRRHVVIGRVGPSPPVIDARVPGAAGLSVRTGIMRP